jgi:transcriptional regulator with XRE-family HTH domain
MQARALTTNRLAQLVGVSQSHLSRAVRSADRKSVSGELAARVAIAMGLPDDWFRKLGESACSTAFALTPHCAIASTTI